MACNHCVTCNSQFVSHNTQIQLSRTHCLQYTCHTEPHANSRPLFKLSLFAGHSFFLIGSQSFLMFNGLNCSLIQRPCSIRIAGIHSIRTGNLAARTSCRLFLPDKPFHQNNSSPNGLAQQRRIERLTGVFAVDPN